MNPVVIERLVSLLEYLIVHAEEIFDVGVEHDSLVPLNQATLFVTSLDS